MDKFLDCLSLLCVFFIVIMLIIPNDTFDEYEDEE